MRRLLAPRRRTRPHRSRRVHHHRRIAGSPVQRWYQASQHAEWASSGSRRDGEGRRSCWAARVRQHRHPQPRHGRDGLPVALLLCEDDGAARREPGSVDWTICSRRLNEAGVRAQGLKIATTVAGFRAEIVPNYAPAEICGKQVVDVDRRDGGGSSTWRRAATLRGDECAPPAPEPLVRIYAGARDGGRGATS